MIYKLNIYFKNEIFTYWFLSIMPFIFLIEILVYLHNTSSHEASMLLFFQSLMALSVLIGIGLVTFQIISNIRFLRDVKKLSPEMIESVKTEMETVTKRGRYLLSKDILIYYGYFKKKIYKRNEVSRWKRNQGIHSQHVPKAGCVSVSYDNTVIYFKNGYGYMDMIDYPIYPLESDKETKGELPYNGILVVFVSAVFLISMIMYPRILIAKAPALQIEKFLFLASYEADYCMNAVIITVISGVVGFVIRCIIKPLNLKKDKLKTFNFMRVSLILLAITAMFVVGFYGSEKKEAALVLEDLNSYYAGKYSVLEGNYQEGTVQYNEVGSDIYDYAYRKGFNPAFLSKPGYGLIFLKDAFEVNPVEGREYKVEFLENTRIIVSIVEKD